jgi:hypothetical protein
LSFGADFLAGAAFFPTGLDLALEAVLAAAFAIVPGLRRCEVRAAFFAMKMDILNSHERRQRFSGSV